MLGDIVVRLYDETPIHRDNFVKLAKEGYYDGTLFHRVIKDFMIQGGDPDSKGAPAGKKLGVGDPGYTLEAEIKDGLFHKRGALAAARQGDEVNPERRSSGSQFYIVWGHYSGDEEVWEPGTKEMLDDMHKRKIDMADEIFVINVGGYIGESTRSEIAYAEKNGKKVNYLEARKAKKAHQ